MIRIALQGRDAPNLKKLMSQQKPQILSPEEQKEFDKFITPLIEEHKKEKESNKGSLTL